jgi:hypothetical protein
MKTCRDRWPWIVVAMVGGIVWRCAGGIEEPAPQVIHASAELRSQAQALSASTPEAEREGEDGRIPEDLAAAVAQRAVTDPAFAEERMSPHSDGGCTPDDEGAWVGLPPVEPDPWAREPVESESLLAVLLGVHEGAPHGGASAADEVVFSVAEALESMTIDERETMLREVDAWVEVLQRHPPGDHAHALAEASALHRAPTLEEALARAARKAEARNRDQARWEEQMEEALRDAAGLAP